jgi:RNA polymerase sigma factor (sigma-70 family)
VLGDPHEAEEVVQEVFMKAWQASAGVAAPLDWPAWLTRVAINACRDRRRAGWWMRFRRDSQRVEDLGLPGDGASPADAAASEDMRRRIWAALRRLPARQREVFVLRYVEELSTAEVAAVLALSAGSVKQHLFRAIHRLRRALGDSR